MYEAVDARDAPSKDNENTPTNAEEQKDSRDPKLPAKIISIYDSLTIQYPIVVWFYLLLFYNWIWLFQCISLHILHSNGQLIQ